MPNLLNINHKGLLLLLSLVVAAGGRADAGDDNLGPYTVSIHLHGDKGSISRDLLRSVSTAAADTDRPPPTLTLLGSIAESDIKKMEKVLRSESFYGGTVKFNFKENEDPIRLIFSVTTGPPFLIQNIAIKIAGATLPEDVIPPDEKYTGLKQGDRGTAAAIIAGGAGLLNQLRQQGYPFVKLADRRVTVDYATEAIDITYTIDPGERAVFGKTTIEGLEDVDEEFLLSKIPWQEGWYYDPALIQEFRNRVSRAGLFSMVLIPPIKRDIPATPRPGASPVPTPQASSADTSGPGPAPLALPINITVRERARHTVGLMAGYSTDLGIGGGASWEDRNLLGEGESLLVKLFASEKLYMVEGRFVLPEFLSPNQSLIIGIQPVYDNPDAYTSYRVRASALLRNEVSQVFSFSGGGALTTDRVDQLDRTRNYILGSMPLNAQLSIGGSPPFRRAGALLSLLGEPYWDFTNDRLFLKSLLNANILYRFPGRSGSRVSGRISFGSIPGSSQGEVPADLRFYGGGANSIRGYGYQMVGPMSGDRPIGGRSLLTFSLEFDQEIIGDFGAAAFLDGGSAFSHDLPRPEDDILWGTGAGLRYFTPIGPIGLDFAIPLNKRKGIDDNFQVYVSIAQIF